MLPTSLPFRVPLGDAEKGRIPSLPILTRKPTMSRDQMEDSCTDLCTALDIWRIFSLICATHAHRSSREIYTYAFVLLLTMSAMLLRSTRLHLRNFSHHGGKTGSMLFSSSAKTFQRPEINSSPSEGATERMNDSNKSTHFGFRDVAEEDKEGLGEWLSGTTSTVIHHYTVGGVFSSVASSYDIMNDAMSLGIHRLWKDHFVSQLDPRGGINCLDVAGGTGDIARRILDHCRTQHSDRQTHVTILDINAKMLRAGQRAMRQTMYWDTPQLSFQLGNAEDLSTSIPPDFDGKPQVAAASQNAKQPRNTPALPALSTIPIPDNSMDLYTIAFGIRNCTHIDRVLSEAYRVLKPGGVFACLEFGKVGVPVLAEYVVVLSLSISTYAIFSF